MGEAVHRLMPSTEILWLDLTPNLPAKAVEQQTEEHNRVPKLSGAVGMDGS